MCYYTRAMAWLSFERQKQIDERVDKLFADLGMKVYPHSLIGDFINKYNEKNKIKISIKPKDFREYSYQVFGAIDVNDAKNPIIYFNWNKPPNNRRFTIVHELGHYLLGHTKNKPTKFRLDLESNLYPRDKETTQEELEANYFAATFLMPKIEIEKQIKGKKLHTLTQDEIEGLRRLFNVSEVAIRTRLAWMQRENSNLLKIKVSNEQD